MGLILPFRANRLAFPGGLPGIDPAHPASQNAILSALPATGNFVNLATKIIGTATATSQKTDSIVGPGVSFTAGSVTYVTGTLSFPPFTMAAIIRTGTLPNAAAHETFVAFGTGAGPLFHIRQTTAVLTLFDGSNIVSSGITLASNTPYFLAVSQNATTCYFVVKNLQTGQVTSATVAQARSPVTDNKLWIGNDSFGDAFIGTIGATSVSLVSLTLLQLLRWADDPWSFWYPQKFDLAEAIRTPPSLAAGGGSDTSRQRSIIFQSKPNRLAFPGTNALPGINPAHPAAQNLRTLVVPQGANGLCIGGTVGFSKGILNGTYVAAYDANLGLVVSNTATAGIGFQEVDLPASVVGSGYTLAGFIRTNNVSLNNVIVSIGDCTSVNDFYLNIGITGASTLTVRVPGNFSFDSGLVAQNNVPYFCAASLIYRGSSTWDSYWVLKRLDTGQVLSSSIHSPGVVGLGALSGSSAIAYYAGAGNFANAAGAKIGPAMTATSALTLGQLLRWADDPWSFWYPQRIDLAELLRPPPPSGPTGTLAVTEPTDVAAFAGNAGTTGTLATTEATDVAAFTGAGAISGTLATTEAADVAAFAGTVAIVGTLATTEATDVAAFAGNVGSVGVLAATEAADVTAFAGTFTGVVSGTLGAIELPDAAAFAGSAAGLPVGILIVQELPDTMIFAVSQTGLPTAPSPYPSPLDYGWYNSEPNVWIDRGRPGGGTQD